jgi:hypothetical protein
MKKDSSKKERLIEMQVIKDHIIHLLCFTEHEYAEMQMNAGLSFLTMKLEGDEYMIDKMNRSKIFWSWWRNQWAVRDESFLFQNQNMHVSRLGMLLVKTMESRSDYLLLHNPYHLVTIVDDYGKTLREGYNQVLLMIQKDI